MPGLANVVRPLCTEYFRHYAKYRREHHGEKDLFDRLSAVVPHQISRKLIEDIARALGRSMDFVTVTADEFGNTAAAAIPHALHEIVSNGHGLSLGSGKEILLFGAASGIGMGHVRLRL
jgi:3-oxoacyl-[acyl-carrier-protein] synthase-3